MCHRIRAGDARLDTLGLGMIPTRDSDPLQALPRGRSHRAAERTSCLVAFIPHGQPPFCSPRWFGPSQAGSAQFVTWDAHPRFILRFHLAEVVEEEEGCLFPSGYSSSVARTLIVGTCLGSFKDRSGSELTDRAFAAKASRYRYLQISDRASRPGSEGSQPIRGQMLIDIRQHCHVRCSNGREARIACTRWPLRVLYLRFQSSALILFFFFFSFGKAGCWPIQSQVPCVVVPLCTISLWWLRRSPVSGWVLANGGKNGTG